MPINAPIQLSDAPSTELCADIVEFLQYYRFTRTLEAFENERSAAISAKQPYPAVGEKEHDIIIRDMMKAFDSGDRERFLASWRQTVPVLFLQSHAWAVKLEFGLHVHFALFPLFHDKEKANRADVMHRMVHFKQYLETKGSAMAYHHDFLVYFALPHVSEPEHHPSFQHLLDPQCMVAQRAQLEIFLSMLPRSGRQPRLYTMLQAEASSRRAERECSKQIASTNQQDLQSLLKGDAELEEFVQVSEQVLTTEHAVEACQDPPFKAVEHVSAHHSHVYDSCGASARVVADKGVHSAVSQRSACTEGGLWDREPHESVESHQDKLPVVEDTSVEPNGRAEHSAQHSQASQRDTEHPLSEPVTKDGHNVVGQKDSDSVQAGGDSPQQNEEADAVDDASQAKTSAGIPTSLDTRPAADESEGVEIDDRGSSEKDQVMQQPSSSRGLEDPTFCASLDSMQTSQRHQAVPQAALSRSEIITRTSLQQSQLPAIDWNLVREHLQTRDNTHRTHLLQAIRWRLIKSPVGLERQSMLAVFAHHDILECNSADAQPGLIGSLASTNDVGLMMELVRLMSVLASDYAGRAYLLQSQSIVLTELHKILISAPSAMLHTKEGDAVHNTDLQSHALAAIQKLSLRRSVQQALVQCQVVPWTLEFLRRHETLSEHAVEYGLATIMNLCLCRAGRKACEGLEVFNVLDGLIQDSNLQVRTYVHGTYYALLSRKHFQDLAHERGLADMLMAVSATSDPMFQNQIGHILKHMEEAPEDDSTVELHSSQEDLGIDTMQYDDEFDEIHNVMSSGRLVGEELLRSEYALPESVATQMRMHPLAVSGESMHALDRSSHASDPFSRPVTPMNRSRSKRHMGSRDARKDVSQSDSALTMRARAEKAAMHVPGKSAVKEEYVTAFAGKELARTPPHSNK